MILLIVNSPMLRLTKVAKSMREIVKLAISKAQKSRLSRYTSFSRITSPSGDLDPFDGEVAFPSVNYVL